MAFTPTRGAGSALAASMISKHQAWYAWAQQYGQTGKLMVGETGWPQSSGGRSHPQYSPGFDLVGEQMYLDYDANNVHVTQWATSNWALDLDAYLNDTGGEDTLNYRSTVSSVIERHYTTGGTGVMRGVNYGGPEFSDVGPDGGLNAGTLHQQYYYPKAADIAKLAARGVPLIRLPIRWERLQSTLKGPLVTSELSLIKQVLTDAAANNVKVLLDMHNYGRYDTQAATNTTYTNNGVVKLGDNTQNAGSLLSCFVDFWSKVSAALNGYSALWSYGLCNEPQGITGGAATWQEACRQAVEAIRINDQTKHINVGGYFFSGIEQWVQNNTVNGTAAPWLTETIPTGQAGAGNPRNSDPLIVWEGHIYMDYDGRYANTSYPSDFTSLNQTAKNNGFNDYATSGYTLPTSDITTQQVTQRYFASTFSGTGSVPDDFSAKYDSVATGDNTVTFGTNGLTLPTTSMKIVTTATSNTAGVRKSFVTDTGSASVRGWQVDFGISASSTVAVGGSNNFAISHAWKNNNSDSLVQIAVTGVADGKYIVGLRDPADTTYSLVNTGNTALSKNTMYKLNVKITDTDIKLYVDNSTTAEATITGTFIANGVPVAIGGYFRGKFYGQSFTGNMYFANEYDYNSVSIAAPPNAGLIGTANGATSNTGQPIGYASSGGSGTGSSTGTAPTTPTNPTTPTGQTTPPTTGGTSGAIFRDNGASASVWTAPTGQAGVSFGGNTGFTGVLGASPSLQIAYTSSAYAVQAATLALPSTATVFQFWHRVQTGATIGKGATVFTIYGETTYDNSKAVVRLDVTPISGSATKFKYSFIDPSGGYVQTVGTTEITVGTDNRLILVQASTGWKLYLNNVPTAEINYAKTQAAVGMTYIAVGTNAQTDTGGIAGTMNFGEFWIGNKRTVGSSAAEQAYDMYQGYLQRHLAVSGQTYKGGQDGSNNSYVGGFIDCVSEGVAYMELLNVQNNDQVTFIKVDNWVLNNMLRRSSTNANTSSNAAPTSALNLMVFHFNSANTDGKGRGTIYDANFATDADVERMQALFWAHGRWGSSTESVGSVAELAQPNYLQRGLNVANDLRQYAFSNSATTGFNYLWNDTYQNGTTIQMGGDYASPAAFKLAAQYDTANTAFWNKAVSGAYDSWTKAANVIFSGGNAGNGGAQSSTAKLNPNWFAFNLNDATVSNTPSTYDSSAGSTEYGYNSFRVYPRLQDAFTFYNETAAKTTLALPAQTFKSNWNSLGYIPATIKHDGTVTGNYEKEYFTSAALYTLIAAGETTTANAIISAKLTNRYVQLPQGSIYNQTGDSSLGYDYYGQSWGIRNYMTQANLWQNFMPGTNGTTPQPPVTVPVSVLSRIKGAIINFGA